MVRVPRHGAALGINDQDISMVTPMTVAGAPNGRQTQDVDVGHYLDETVYPALFGRLAGAFPEFPWQSHGRDWMATIFPPDFPMLVEHPRPDRLMAYADRPWWIKVHGHSGVRFLEYVNGGRRPTGAEFPAAVREVCKRAGVPFPEREWTPEQAARLHQREQRRLALEAVIATAEVTLWSPAGSDARAYLVKRGFTEAALRDLRVGLYYADAARTACATAGLSAADIKAARGVTPNLEGYIVFPWNDATGQPLTIYGRWPATPPGKQPKTIVRSGTTAVGGNSLPRKSNAYAGCSAGECSSSEIAATTQQRHQHGGIMTTTLPTAGKEMFVGIIGALVNTYSPHTEAHPVGSAPTDDGR